VKGDDLFGSEGDLRPTLTWREIRHFVDAPRRRPLTVIVAWVTVVLLSVAALYTLPKKYRSSILILVESEKVPESFVPRVATGDPGRGLDAIRPEILSRTRLERVLNETHPFPISSGLTAAVEAMRGSISVEPSGRDGFSIEFVHSDPHKAQEVANRLATLFIEETTRAREAQVGGAVDFLVKQVEEARKALEKKDEALRRFKEERMGRLPEQLGTNLATLDMLQRQMQTLDDNLFFARERQATLAGRLVPGTGATTPSGDTGELAEARRQLAALRARRYTDEHPDVQSLRSRIARLEERQERIAAGEAPPSLDPALAVAREQMEKVNLEVQNLEEKKAHLERQIASVRANVENTPRTEQELSTLTRDYQQLNDNYQALLSKQLEAEMAGRLEQRWKGQRFRILDPANLPEKPYAPDARLIIGFGVLLGLFAGLGVAVVFEYLDSSVKDLDELRALQDYPVLATIPHHPGLGKS